MQTLSYLCRAFIRVAHTNQHQWLRSQPPQNHFGRPQASVCPRFQKSTCQQKTEITAQRLLMQLQLALTHQASRGGQASEHAGSSMSQLEGAPASLSRVPSERGFAVIEGGKGEFEGMDWDRFGQREWDAASSSE